MRTLISLTILLCLLYFSNHVNGWRCSLKVIGAAGGPAETLLQAASMDCRSETRDEANTSLVVTAADSVLAHNSNFTGVLPTFYSAHYVAQAM